MKLILKIALSVPLVLMFNSCKSNKNRHKIETKYLITRLDSINNWYIIYAARKDSLYKIISKKAVIIPKATKKIVKGKSYSLSLNSQRENAPVINGIKVATINYLDVNCYGFDKETKICIEPEKGYFDLYTTSDLNGLYIVR